MELVFLTLRHPGGFGDFQKKQRLNARGFAWKFLLSGVLYRPVKVSKDAASLLVCTQKKSLECGFFVCDVISGGLLGRPPWPTLPGPGCQLLGGSILLKFFWKLGYNPSLLILWMTCWDFRFKSCDV